MENQQDNKPKKNLFKEFRATTIALKNRTSVMLLTIALIVFGLTSYNSLPKELFPDVYMPIVMVQTAYPGNPPVDMENLVTRPLEKELETIKGLKKISSTSYQDFSMIFVEFTSGIEINDALQEVRDAVDKAKSELPDDLPKDPSVEDIDFSEFPFININLSGDYSLDELKEYAEDLEDEIDGIYEVSKVLIQGINEKEVKVNVDVHKMQAYELSFTDIENAIAFENMSVSGGEIKIGNTRRSVRTIGEFTDTKEIENIIVKSEDSRVVYMRDVAEVEFGYEEPTSITRLDGQTVVSLQVVKKSGENLLSATAQIEDILDSARSKKLIPDNLRITVTNDQSEMIEKQLNNLENSMILSVIFVITVLFFFLGTRNALMVGLAIPLSMFLSFGILSIIDYRINMMVLFGLILALGMLVDNAIVVVENIYRFLSLGYKRFEAAKLAVGEVAIPIIASTMTTLAAFIPLAFWDSMMGEFMKYLPITLIIVLSSSLFVALVIVPVFSASLAKKGLDQSDKINIKRGNIIGFALVALSLPMYLGKVYTLANLLALAAIITFFNIYIFSKVAKWFQEKFLVWLENYYLKVLKKSLKLPLVYFGGTIVLLILTVMFLGARQPKVEFFPSGDPNYINVLAELPIGTDIEETDAFMKNLESTISIVLTDYKPIIESVLTNVGDGARAENEFGATGGVNKGLITITFLDYEERGELSTADAIKLLSDNLTNRYPGIQLNVVQNQNGPPTGKPINLEISGDEYDQLISLTEKVQQKVESSDIKGIEGLMWSLKLGKPEMIVKVDRDKARKYGLSTGQIAGTLRTALFGKDVSDFKQGEDEYPIQLRLEERYRYSIPALMNQLIIFRNNQGKLVKIPISAVADFTYSTTYGSVKRIDLNRVITLSSNVIEGYNATEINAQIGKVLAEIDMPEGYKYKFTGEQQEQQESAEFMMKALMIAIALILIILVTQFNSVMKPAIILMSVLFSTIGVFGGIAMFGMNIIVVMTGIGIVSLAGVVVNNAIVLIDYIDQLKARKREELGLEEDAFLPVEVATECIVNGGKTRLRPVLLTAITTILGLFPMALGMNINFRTMLAEFSPQFSIGGDMAVMWGPLSWTVIFGLTFATFLTLVIVPVMYRLTTQAQKSIINIGQLFKGRPKRKRSRL